MKAYAEFRIPEDYAKEFLPDNLGKSTSTKIAKRVRVLIGSEIYNQIGEIYELVRNRDQDYFFLGWEIQRTYSQNELDSARLLLLKTIKTFEPAGEECGTIYDNQNICDICGAGIRQVSELILDLNTIPKNVNIARTISDEIIIDQEFVDILVNNNITGYQLDPVHHKGLQKRSYGHQKKAWHQLIFTSTVNVHPTTKTGENPFDEDKENMYRCKKGHTIGLDILSDLSVYENSWDGSDIVATREFLGVNRGLLRTSPLLLVSQKLFRLMREKQFKGFTLEVAHLIK